MSKKFEKKITTTIEISQKNIVFFFIAIASVYVLYLLKDLVLGLFISILFSTALNPLVSKIESLKVPRSIAAALVYFLIIAFITISVGTIVPTLVVQTLNLMNSLPLQTVSQQLNLFEVNLENIQLISNQVGSVIPVIKVIGSTFSGIITIFTFLVITFYLLIERKKLHKYIAKLFADGDAEQKAEKLISKVEAQIGGWVRGESILMIIVGLITYIGLRLLNVPFALPLAILAGVL